MFGNVKNIKVDSTGFFLKKNDEPSKQSVDSDISSVSEDEDVDHSLVHLQNVPSNVTVIKEGGAEKSEENETVTEDNNEENKSENNIDSYLSVKNNNEEETVKSQYSENDMNTEELPPQEEQAKSSEINERNLPPNRNEYYSDDEEEIIDMTENKLYEVLASVLEDEQGENVSENLAKINRNLERHNDLMGKILNELVNMSREKHKERRFFEALTRKLDRNSLNTDFETSIQPSDNDNDNDNENKKKGGSHRIQRMKNRIDTPDIKQLNLGKK